MANRRSERNNMLENNKKSKRLLTIWEHYLVHEIAIEFKACLYFFCILFFYSMYRILCGSWEASIIHMTEMILATYAMGYVQFVFFENFDEGEKFSKRVFVYSLICTGIYTILSWFFGWFAKSLIATGSYFLYMEFVYLCTFIVYKCKREIDTKVLNEDLNAFKVRRVQNESGD